MYGVFAEMSGNGDLRTDQTMTATAPESVTDVDRTQRVEPTDIDTPGLVFRDRRSQLPTDRKRPAKTSVSKIGDKCNSFLYSLNNYFFNFLIIQT